MRSIDFFDRQFPVRTVFSELEDHRRHEDWRDDEARTAILEDFLRTPLNRVIPPRETHSGNIRLVTGEQPEGSLAYTDERFSIKGPGGHDSIVTDVPGVLIHLWTADCLPLYLYDPVRHAAAVVHNGWRGACGGITVNTLRVMRERFGTDSRDVAAAIGPCICGSCYEVGEELLQPFRKHFGRDEAERFFTPGNAGKYYLDVRKAVCSDLAKAGVRAERICDIGICSFEDHAFASYRRDGIYPHGEQTLSGIVLL